MREIEVVVRLSYPITNKVTDQTSESGRYAELLIEDGLSGETLVRVALSPTSTRATAHRWTSRRWSMARC